MYLKLFIFASLSTTVMATPPNVLFILNDDQGYNEVGFMNATSKAYTPNLDRVAAQGVVLRKYYVHPICSPTRSALMTGKYTHRIGTQANVIYWDTPWAPSLEHKFLPQYLKESETTYHTGMFGKWHLGMHKDAYYPWNRGFDVHEGYLQGCGSGSTHICSCCSTPSNVTNQSDKCAPSQYTGYDWFKNKQPDYSALGTRSAELIRKGALNFLDIHAARNDGSRFFLYLPFQNIHAPYDYTKKWEKFMQELPDANRRDEDETALYGYLAEADDVFGDVVNKLHSTGLWNNTLILFSSDNGAPSHLKNPAERNYPFSGFKNTIWEGGHRVPGFVSGGFVPEAARGTTTNALIHVTDWLATIAHVIGLPEEKLADIDGVNQWDVITKGTPDVRKEMPYTINPQTNSQFQDVAAYRFGNYKIVANEYRVAGIKTNGTLANSTGPLGQVWLYDLDVDVGEKNDISKDNPNLVDNLLAKLKAEAERSVPPMIWTPPYQGDDYECSDCPLHPPSTNETAPWVAWL